MTLNSDYRINTGPLTGYTYSLDNNPTIFHRDVNTFKTKLFMEQSMNITNQIVAVIGLALLFGVSSNLTAKEEIQSSRSTNETYVQLHTASNSGFYTAANSTRLSNYRSGVWRSGDFNGDGRDDLISIYGGQVHVIDGAFYRELHTSISLSNGSSFAVNPRRRSLGVDGGNALYLYRWLVGDFNGDGKDDLADIRSGAKFEGGRKAVATVHLSSETGITPYSFRTTLAGIAKNQRWMVGDFNGDGKDDLVNVYGVDNSIGRQTARAWVHLSTGEGFEHNSSFTVFSGFRESQRWMVDDFNGDGMDDLVNVYGRNNSYGGQTARAWLHLSTGDGFEYNSGFTILDRFSTYQHWLPGDFDSDGKSDLVNVHWFKPYYYEPLRSKAWVHSSNGNRFEYQSGVTVFNDEFTSNPKWLTGDFNGDGTDDLVHIF